MATEKAKWQTNLGALQDQAPLLNYSPDVTAVANWIDDTLDSLAAEYRICKRSKVSQARYDAIVDTMLATRNKLIGVKRDK